jgi:hypothetical protein
MEEDIWNQTIWNSEEDIWNKEDLDDNEVVINEPPSYQLGFDDEEVEFEEEDEEITQMRNDPDVSKWLPERKPVSTGGFSGIFKNEGARTGQPTNLNSSAIGRGQMIKGTREAMYKKLGVRDFSAAEEAFKRDPDFEMQVLNAYREELDGRIPSHIQGKQRDYMIAKGWYTGDPFYDDNKVPGKSAGNRLTAGEYARRAVMQYGDAMFVSNIPQLLEAEKNENNDPNLTNIANVVQTVDSGISKFRNLKERLAKIQGNVAETISDAIDFQTETAAAQRNAQSMRRYNEQRRVKKYSANDTNLNQPLIYT